jgi:hypothetical protein
MELFEVVFHSAIFTSRESNWIPHVRNFFLAWISLLARKVSYSPFYELFKWIIDPVRVIVCSLNYLKWFTSVPNDSPVMNNTPGSQLGIRITPWIFDQIRSLSKHVLWCRASYFIKNPGIWSRHSTVSIYGAKIRFFSPISCYFLIGVWHNYANSFCFLTNFSNMAH